MCLRPLGGGVSVPVMEDSLRTLAAMVVVLVGLTWLLGGSDSITVKLHTLWDFLSRWL